MKWLPNIIRNFVCMLCNILFICWLWLAFVYIYMGKHLIQFGLMCYTDCWWCHTNDDLSWLSLNQRWYAKGTFLVDAHFASLLSFCFSIFMSLLVLTPTMKQFNIIGSFKNWYCVLTNCSRAHGNVRDQKFGFSKTRTKHHLVKVTSMAKYLYLWFHL